MLDLTSHGAIARATLRHPRRLLVAALALTIGLTTAAPDASASLSCTLNAIKINTGAGAEDPTKAWGHTHSTGRHYVRYFYINGLLEYWADNDGGWDGDTRDTYYGRILC